MTDDYELVGKPFVVTTVWGGVTVTLELQERVWQLVHRMADGSTFQTPGVRRLCGRIVGPVWRREWAGMNMAVPEISGTVVVGGHDWIESNGPCSIPDECRAERGGEVQADVPEIR